MLSTCRVLLAEDNPVNQDVGRAMIETFGCRIDVASNGREALRLLEANRYDLVFMDCQMPEMDGWTATVKIREAESAGAARVPVIALTGSSTDTDIERCRAAGMDDYLGKPFSLRDLSQMLNRWLAPAKDKGAAQGPGAAKTGPEAARRQRPCLDPEALDNLTSILGTRAPSMIAAVMNVYLSDSPPLVEALRRALETGDPDGLGRASHALKSSSANLGANVLAGLCGEIEHITRSGSTRGAEELVRQVEAEYRGVEEALRETLNRGR
ncbi:MAG: response regulator [Syntrophobacteraceae bacterium]